MALLQWRNGVERQFLRRELPVGKKLRLVKHALFKNMAESPRRKTARHNACLDFHGDLEFTVLRMKVRWCMFPIIHAD